jgi:general secretion pathway protein C
MTLLSPIGVNRFSLLLALDLPFSLSMDPSQNESKSKLTALTERAREMLRSGGVKGLARLSDLTRAQIEKQGLNFYSTVAAIALSAYFVSDLIVVGVQGKLPQIPQKSAGSTASSRQAFSLSDFAVISSRNLFNSEGKIPGEESGAPGAIQDPGGVPVKTSLPFNLIGTIILKDELRSIATIEDRSASLVYPVRLDDEIPSKAKILKIEPRKVIFINTASGRREYVELPEEFEGGAPRVAISPSGKAATAIDRQGNSFNIPRLELDRAFADLNTVLQQARAVPHYENGVPAGYKLFQVVPEGLFAKLGLKEQDIICGIDGQPVNDPAKALELLNQMRTANHVDLCVKRDGKTQTFAYDVR